MKRNNWHNYYKDTQYKMKASNLILHWQYLLKIILSRPKSILEIGCGPANHSIFIKFFLKNSNLYLLDNDRLILEEIKKRYNSRVNRYFNLDVLDSEKIKKIPKVDLVMSQGLLEHFNDGDFVRILKNFSGAAKKMIFSAPSEHYGSKDFGNERLRSKREIEDLLKKSNLKKYRVCRYFDIGIRTKITQISKGKINLRNIIRTLFQSNHLFVEI